MARGGRWVALRRSMRFTAATANHNKTTAASLASQRHHWGSIASSRLHDNGRGGNCNNRVSMSP